MRVLLITKRNEAGSKADAAVRERLADAEIETVFGNRSERRPAGLGGVDLLISFLCPWILPRSVLETCGDAINFHPGPPEYPGFGCYNFAIYEKAAEYGVTCHRIDEAIDHGEIIGVKRFRLDPAWTPEPLQVKTLDVLHELLLDVLQQIASGTPLTRVEEWRRKATNRADFEALRRIPRDADAKETRLRIQAFEHSTLGGAYIEHCGIAFTPPPGSWRD
jgi:methionyl-tRNA formyltransferase